ncbi:MAG: Ig domain-containing protein, partial [Candidatus Ornithospirochaeta sp.]
MRKALVIVLFSLLLLLSFSSCSEDPRVAPTKVFIVSVNGEKREVKFEDDIRFVKIGIYENVSLGAVTNRVPSDSRLLWSSIAPEVASVDENGLCTGLSLGDTIIQVSLNGGKETAVCWISVVADPDHIPDSEEGVSSLEIVSIVELMYRDILTVENGVPTIKASTIDELRNIPFPVKCNLEDTKYPG